MLQPLAHLPAFELVPSLNNAIKQHNVIVGAPPGAGKSTVLPLALLQENIEGKILLMQPRRVVVRHLADYLATLVGEPLGQKVGYRIKGESKATPDTKLEVITEGILSRMIQQDPELPGVGAIVFDEFHERSIHSDFGLALALEVQAGLRDDLRLVIMSATLDIEPLKKLLESHSALPVTHLTSEGRMFPVEVHYTQDTSASELVPRMSTIIKQAIAAHDGDVLVFLPGRGSMKAVARNIHTLVEREDIALHSLFGALDKASQQEALSPDPQGRRKIVLATNIAETSLTIEGVNVVIDSLWENSAQYHISSEVTELTQQRISQASAIQRMGRAGRVSAGTCYRLCSKESFERLAKHSAAQIEKEDVSALLLNTYAWGSQVSSLALLTLPSRAQCEAAEKKLLRIDALTLSTSTNVDEKANLVITHKGRYLAQMPCEPHLANLLMICNAGVEGLDIKDNNALRLAAVYVVALSETTMAISSSNSVYDALLHATAATRNQLHQAAKRYAPYVGLNRGDLNLSMLDEKALGLCIALAFPMQVGYLREESQAKDTREYKLASGKGAKLDARNGSIEHQQWLAVLHGQLIAGNVTIRLAQAVPEKWLKLAFSDAFLEKHGVKLNSQSGHMEARSTIGFYDIELHSTPISRQQKTRNKVYWDNALVDAWVNYLDSLPIEKWPLSDEDWQWWYRVALAAKLNLPQDKAFDGPDPWPTLLNELVHKAKDSLKTALCKCQSISELKKLPWRTALNNGLSWPQQEALASLLPTTIAIPTGRNVALSYRDNGDVVLSVKMTEMYSQASPLLIANGRVKVICELLSPAGRPLQTTSDLQAFWQGSYKEIQKEMKGRYPKHFWPDEPALAAPTSKTKKHM